MSNIFNTPFETSLRVLLTLEAAGEQSETSDMIAAADFITIYGRDFSMADENLHGDNNFKFSEFALLRELVNKAVKRLVVDGLINVSSKNNNGFSYSINRKGLDYCAMFRNDYAETYRHIAQQARTYMMNKSERETLVLINQLSVTSLQRSTTNG